MTLIQGQGQGHVALKVRNFQKLSHPPFPVGAGKNQFLEDNITVIFDVCPTVLCHVTFELGRKLVDATLEKFFRPISVWLTGRVDHQSQTELIFK